MGVRTNQKQTLAVLDAHMNARCEDDHCETCTLRTTFIAKDISYCYALSIFAEKFFVDRDLKKGTQFVEGYISKLNGKFRRILFPQETHIIEENEVKPKYEAGMRVSHFRYGNGTILGNYHKRPDGKYYWHIRYDNNTFGYNQESSLTPLDE